VNAWIIILILLVNGDQVMLESQERFETREDCLRYGSRQIYIDIPELVEMRMTGQARIYCIQNHEAQA
jgi:hypothetical protein